MKIFPLVLPGGLAQTSLATVATNVWKVGK